MLFRYLLLIVTIAGKTLKQHLKLA